MPEEALFLKPNVQAEPLFDQWYMWPQLVSPATAARNITKRHFKIMDSYLSAPQVHASAVKNPRLLGGPFIDYSGERVEEIQALISRTKSERRHLIEFAEALEALDTLLRDKACGLSLHPLYAQVPEVLRGYVELAYDLNNHPVYRPIEPLLYRSKFYDERAQSLMLSISAGDERPFALSTPRLEDAKRLHLRMAIRDERLNSVFKWKTEATSWTDIRRTLEVPGESESLLRSFFTTEPASPPKAYEGPSMRWRYLGHACILIQTEQVSILTDPVLSYSYASGIPRYTFSDLPEFIDYVVITHNHQDHILIETLLQLRHKIRNIVVPRNQFGGLQDPSLRLLFEALGFRSVIELDELQTIELPGGSIVGLPFFGEHSDLAIGTKLAHLVRIGNWSMLFAADSCNVEPQLYRNLRQIVGDVDVLFLGMECDGAPLSWIYGPLMTQRLDRAMDDSRRLNGSNYDQAVSIVNEFACKEVYIYAMGQEPWLNYVMSLKYKPESRPIVESNKLVGECQRRGILAERLFGQKECYVNVKY